MQARVSMLLSPLLRSFAGTKLMMRNLPWAASKDEVINAVKAIVPFEKLDLPVNLDGRNRGFAFVTFGTEAEKDKATTALAALEIGGRKVSVHEYIETQRGERPPRFGSGFGRGGEGRGMGGRFGGEGRGRFDGEGRGGRFGGEGRGMGRDFREPEGDGEKPSS